MRREVTVALMRANPPVWHRPRSLEAALDLVAAGTTPVGGGAALLSRAFPQLQGDALADLYGMLPSACTPPVVGAGVTLAVLAADAAVGAGWPAVAQAAGLTANPGVRRLATVGGTVAARLVTADLAAPLVLHAAVVAVTTAAGVARLPYIDYLRSASDLGPHLVTGVDLGPPARGAYRRIAGRRGPAPALATVAGLLGADGRLRLCAGAVAALPLPFAPGDPPGAERLADDDRASAAYRARLVAVLAGEVAEALA